MGQAERERNNTPKRAGCSPQSPTSIGVVSPSSHHLRTDALGACPPGAERTACRRRWREETLHGDGSKLHLVQARAPQEWQSVRKCVFDKYRVPCTNPSQGIRFLANSGHCQDKDRGNRVYPCKDY